MIFISYRKEDASDLACSLADKLIEHFGQDSVFLDRHQIEPGDHWREEIDRALSKAAVVLAVIGPRWLTTHDEYGQRRLDRDDDVLAYELWVALQRGIVVIPLYLHGVKPMPAKAFPSRLVGLAGQQGIEFDIVRDQSALLSRLEEVPGLRKQDRSPRAKVDGTLTKERCKPWCIPDSIGSLFKGREEAVVDLRRRFLQDRITPTNNVVLRQVIFGLGGIGKTRLAIEYAWGYQAGYSALLFTVGDSPAQLRRSIAELSAPAILNLQEWKCPEEEIRMAAVIRWLSENPGWLLIIDNVDGKEPVDAVQDLLAKLRGGHVIITSRSSRWSKSVNKRELDVLPLEAAKTFLLDRTNDERRKTPQDEAVALELAQELGGLALALEQAGAYIQNRDGGLSLADYLARWREGKEQVLEWCDESVMHYARSVAITWETSMRALGPAALTLFRILAWFAPDPIPRSMVSKLGALEIIRCAMEASRLPIGELDPEQALSELIAYSMTKKVDEQGVACVGLHRVVLQIMRDRMPPEAKDSTIVAAAQLLVLFAPKDSYRPETWMDWRLLISHAAAIWGVLRTRGEEHWNIELMKMLALYHMGQGRNEDGVPIQREVLRLVQQRLSPDDPEIFLAKNDLALMLSTDEKEQLLREALEGGIRVRGLECVETAETQHNLASHLSSRNPQEAERLLQQAISTIGKIKGLFHWRTLMAEMTLAGLLIDQGQAEAGEEMIRKNIEKKCQHLGPDHPDTLSAISKLADLLLKTGCAKEAFALQQRVLESQERELGSEHPDFIRALNQHAYGLRKAGLIAEAALFDRRSASTSVKVLGETHPLALHRRSNLVLTLILLGKLDDAREILSQNAQVNAPPHENLTSRVAFLRWVVELLADKESRDRSQNAGAQPVNSTSESTVCNQHSSFCLGRLKTLFAREPLPIFNKIQVPWDIAYFIDALEPKLGTQNTALLRALVAVLNARTAPAASTAPGSPPSELSSLLTALDAFPAWREATPQPLE